MVRLAKVVRSALQNAASMRVEHYARTVAPAIEQLFSIVHELISKHNNKPQLRNSKFALKSKKKP